LEHYVIGTAGHIDHGKTSLTKLLTGIDTDRLKEEKERSISIELGFAPLKLPNGEQVSLIDVPGHEKFIRHMVAGVGGIDLVLLVIAADEGIMPQTKEHIQILEFMGVQKGIIVLTKIDMVDIEFLTLVEEDVRNFMQNTIFTDSPIAKVSNKTGEGISELKLLINNELKKTNAKSKGGFFRLPIDRVFTKKGLGTIVTGTTYSGQVAIGDELELLPAEKLVRVKSIQVHNKSVDTAYAGQRTALNLSGIELTEVSRGDSLVTPKHWKTSTRVDAELTTVKDLDFAVKERSEVKFHIGTKEVLATLILFDRKEVNKGEKVYCQFILNEPIISSREERFIIRRPSPSITIGGGIIIEPLASKHKHTNKTVKELKEKKEGTIKDLILIHLQNAKQYSLLLTELANLLTIPPQELLKELLQLNSEGKVIILKEQNSDFYLAKEKYEELLERIIDIVHKYHQANPARKGMPKAELLQNVQINNKLFNQIINLLVDQQKVIELDDLIKIYNFNPQVSSKIQEKVNLVENILIGHGLTPPNWDEIMEQITLTNKEKEELVDYLLAKSLIIKLTDKIYIEKNIFLAAQEKLINYLEMNKTINIQQAKELFNISRKYLVPLMELFDKEKITIMKKDYRVLARRNI